MPRVFPIHRSASAGQQVASRWGGCSQRIRAENALWTNTNIQTKARHSSGVDGERKTHRTPVNDHTGANYRYNRPGQWNLVEFREASIMIVALASGWLPRSSLLDEGPHLRWVWMVVLTPPEAPTGNQSSKSLRLKLDGDSPGTVVGRPQLQIWGWRVFYLVRLSSTVETDLGPDLAQHSP